MRKFRDLCFDEEKEQLEYFFSFQYYVVKYSPLLSLELIHSLKIVCYQVI